MNLLLDTCTTLWSVREPERLSEKAREALAEKANVRYVSAVTFWEIAQKIRAEKLSFQSGVAEFFALAERDMLLTLIPILPQEALLLADLPLLHRDPFDRMLVCQAKALGLTLVTPDEHIRQYDVPTLW